MAMDPHKNNQPPLPGNHTMLRVDSYKHLDDTKRDLHQQLGECQRLLEKFGSSILSPRVLPYTNIQPQYRIQFIKEVRNPTFTSDLVRDKNGSPMKVAIYDTSTQSIISPDNCLSFAKVKITVLDADFRKNIVNWSRVEFNQSVLRERKRKGPILTGPSCIIQLENGVGTFENIVFNDNSSWTNSGFRLGVMVVSDGEEGYFNGEIVQEGVSEPFQVKDRRGKASQKPDRLELTHSVRCIKKIGKDRTFLLQTKGIKKVENFLWCYYNKKSELREILGIKSEYDKGWMSMIEHVKQCKNEFHAKYNALNNSSQPRTLVDPMEGNCEHFVVGSGSSEPNPSQNVRIEGSTPAVYRRHVETQIMAPVIPNDGGIPQPYPFGLSVDDYYYVEGQLTPNYGSSDYYVEGELFDSTPNYGSGDIYGSGSGGRGNYGGGDNGSASSN